MSHCTTDQCHGALHSNSSMINAQTDFSMNLFRQNGINSSTILSPISITIALAMMYLGAKDNTAAQIRNTIANGIPDDEIHSYFSSFLNYSNNFENIKLESANRIYVGNNAKIEQTYIDGIKKYYNGECEQIDFRQFSEAADKINKYVAEATHNKFQNIIDADSINSVTRLLSINAIYFKGEWQHSFSKENTVEANFYSSPDKTKTVKMMSEKFRKAPYYENDDYEIIGLPYNGYEAAMFIILPREKFGLEGVMRKIDSTTLIDVLTNHGQANGVIKLPRFKIESSIDLIDSLIHLGITDAFKDNANFSGIFENGDMKISDMFQKAVIETDEESTEAAAVTVSGMSQKSVIYINDFIADHPFMFIIADKNLHFLFTGTFFG